MLIEVKTVVRAWRERRRMRVAALVTEESAFRKRARWRCHSSVRPVRAAAAISRHCRRAAVLGDSGVT